MSLLERTLQAIQPLDVGAMEAARARQNTLTKPPGSLGKLDEHVLTFYTCVFSIFLCF